MARESLSGTEVLSDAAIGTVANLFAAGASNLMKPLSEGDRVIVYR